MVSCEPHVSDRGTGMETGGDKKTSSTIEGDVKVRLNEERTLTCRRLHCTQPLRLLVCGFLIVGAD